VTFSTDLLLNKEATNMSDKRTVLLLEDLPSWQNIVRLLLKSERDGAGKEIYEITTASSLASAMTLLRKRVFDVAIVDICLVEGDPTNKDGMAFLDVLGEFYPDDRTHAIVLSGHGTIALAVDAVKRPYVIDYTEKGPGRFDEAQFVSKVAQAWHLTEAQRAERIERRLRPLSSLFVKASEISQLASSLAPELDTAAAVRDLELLLDNLFLNILPFGREAHATVELENEDEKSMAHILCWSRKLVRALDIAIGRTGTLHSLEPTTYWNTVTGTEIKANTWSVRYFDGIVFELPDVSFEEFLSIAAPNS
jgi:ActR/RegA family two-component response regulator